MRKITSTIMVTIMMVLTLGMFTACSMGQPLDVAVTIDGYDLTIGSSVADLLAAGFDIGETGHPSSKIYESDYDTIPARTIQSVGRYYILKDGKSSEVAIQLVNKSNQDKLISECTIYSIEFNLYYYEYGSEERLDVAIAGVDVTTASLDDILDALTEKGCKFDADEVEGMHSSDPYGTSVTSDRVGDYVYLVTREYDMSTGKIGFGEFHMYQVIDYEY